MFCAVTWIALLNDVTTSPFAQQQPIRHSVRPGPGLDVTVQCPSSAPSWGQARPWYARESEPCKKDATQKKTSGAYAALPLQKKSLTMDLCESVISIIAANGRSVDAPVAAWCYNCVRRSRRPRRQGG